LFVRLGFEVAQQRPQQDARELHVGFIAVVFVKEPGVAADASGVGVGFELGCGAPPRPA
jgi:hypothetical protein